MPSFLAIEFVARFSEKVLRERSRGGPKKRVTARWLREYSRSSVEETLEGLEAAGGECPLLENTTHATSLESQTISDSTELALQIPIIECRCFCNSLRAFLDGRPEFVR